MNTTSDPAHITFSAVEEARKAAAAQAQATWNAKVTAGVVDPDAWKTKMAATRAANRAKREAEVAALAAERENRIAELPTLRAKASVQRARKFDEAEVHRAQITAQLDRLAAMKAAVEVVHALNLRQPGTRRRKALMATANNFESILARGRKAGVA